MSNRTMYSELAKNELLDEFYKASIERNALQARLDEAVELLREASDVINLPWHDARRAFLSRINADGGVK